MESLSEETIIPFSDQTGAKKENLQIFTLPVEEKRQLDRDSQKKEQGVNK